MTECWPSMSFIVAIMFVFRFVNEAVIFCSESCMLFRVSTVLVWTFATFFMALVQRHAFFQRSEAAADGLSKIFCLWR